MAVPAAIITTAHPPVAGIRLANGGTVVNLGTIAGGTGGVGYRGGHGGVGVYVNGGTLDFKGGGNFAGAIKGSGTIRFDATTTLAGAHLLSTNMVEAANLSLGTSTNITNASGRVFTMTTSAGSTITLSGTGSDTLSNAGSLAAIGGGTADIGITIINSGHLTVGSGNLVFLAGATNNGTVAANGGALTFDAKLNGTGTDTIAAGSTLSLLGGAAATQTVDFLAGTGLLDVAQPTAMAAKLMGFGGADHIDLLNAAATSLTSANSTLTVKNGGATVASLHFAGSYTQSEFGLVSDGHGGSFINFV
jgi:hypothetical protein